jgi:hypothetical protein
MLQIFGCLFMLIFLALFVVLAFGLSILSAFLRLFGIKLPINGTRHQSSVKSNDPQQPDSEQPKRVFSDNEGEYVDFEEVKDN